MRRMRGRGETDARPVSSGGAPAGAAEQVNQLGPPRAPARIQARNGDMYHALIRSQRPTGLAFAQRVPASPGKGAARAPFFGPASGVLVLYASAHHWTQEISLARNLGFTIVAV